NTVFAAGADGQTFLKNLPQHFKSQPNQPTTFDTATWQGQWKHDGDNYNVTLTSSGANKFAAATIDGPRLMLKTESETWIFDREGWTVINGRDGEIRTHDLLHPKQARYQATLRPEPLERRVYPASARFQSRRLSARFFEIVCVAWP